MTSDSDLSQGKKSPLVHQNQRLKTYKVFLALVMFELLTGI